MISPIPTKALTPDRQVNTIANTIIDKVNEIAAASTLSRYNQFMFPGTAISESSPSTTPTASSIFYSIAVSGATAVKLGVIAKGYLKGTARVNTVPISGLEFTHYNSNTECTIGEWINIASSEQEISLYLQSDGCVYDFNDGDLTGWVSYDSATWSWENNYVKAVSGTSLYGEYAAPADTKFTYGDLYLDVYDPAATATSIQGIMFNFTAAGTFYTVCMSAYADKVYIMDYVAGTPTTRAFNITTITDSTWYELRASIVQSGSNTIVTAYLNGVSQCTYTYTGVTLTEKLCGLFKRGGGGTFYARFDNFSINGGGIIYQPFLLIK